jgi:uncharacterized membrane protein (UPF0127 family)
MNIKKHYLYIIIKRVQLFLSILGISLLIFPHIYGCKKEVRENFHKAPLIPYNEPQFTKEGELTFFSKNNKKIITIDIEIPDTYEEITRGLMYRRIMAETEGMLFVHDIFKFKARFFWMKNTYIPLDMIFVDNKMQIVKIKKHTTPLSEYLIPVPGETRYTIEVNAGFCDRHGIKIGDSIQFGKIP